MFIPTAIYCYIFHFCMGGIRLICQENRSQKIVNMCGGLGQTHFVVIHQFKSHEQLLISFFIFSIIVIVFILQAL